MFVAVSSGIVVRFEVHFVVLAVTTDYSNLFLLDSMFDLTQTYLVNLQVNQPTILVVVVILVALLCLVIVVFACRLVLDLRLSCVILVYSLVGMFAVVGTIVVVAIFTTVLAVYLC